MDIWEGMASALVARLDLRGVVPKEAREPLLELLRVELRGNFARNLRNVVEVMHSFEPGTHLHDASVREYIAMCRFYDARYGLPEWGFAAECLEAIANHFVPPGTDPGWIEAFQEYQYLPSVVSQP